MTIEGSGPIRRVLAGFVAYRISPYRPPVTDRIRTVTDYELLQRSPRKYGGTGGLPAKFGLSYALLSLVYIIAKSRDGLITMGDISTGSAGKNTSHVTLAVTGMELEKLIKLAIPAGTARFTMGDYLGNHAKNHAAQGRRISGRAERLPTVWVSRPLACFLNCDMQQKKTNVRCATAGGA